MSHTIILIQRTKSVNSRTYLEYPTVQKAMEGIVELFEEKLKKNHSGGSLNYKLIDLEQFVDGCTDFGALVFKNKEGVYVPKGKDWVKKGLEKHVISLAKK